MSYHLTQIDGFFSIHVLGRFIFLIHLLGCLHFFFYLIYSIQTQNFKVFSKIPLYLCFGKLLSTELFLIINLFDWL